MNNLEHKILQEIDGKTSSGFIYKLHYLNYFDYNNFKELMDDIEVYIDVCDNRIIVKNIISSFEHILFLLYCHINPKDIYIINNYDEIEKYIEIIYTDIRELTDSILG